MSTATVRQQVSCWWCSLDCFSLLWDVDWCCSEFPINNVWCSLSHCHKKIFSAHIPLWWSGWTVRLPTGSADVVLQCRMKRVDWSKEGDIKRSWMKPIAVRFIFVTARDDPPWLHEFLKDHQTRVFGQEGCQTKELEDTLVHPSRLSVGILLRSHGKCEWEHSRTQLPNLSSN